MLTPTEVRVLAAFFPEAGEATTRDIEKRSGYSHERVYSTLRGLGRKGITASRKIGRTYLHSLRRFDDKTYLAFTYSSLQRKWQFAAAHPEVGRAIEEFLAHTSPQMAVLFGSYAKGDATRQSDIDILCIGATNADKTALQLRHSTSLTIAPLPVQRGEFRKIRTENPEFWHDLVSLGIVLKGHEAFHDLVYGL